jgi:HAD superfamily hydrolase (TIGR01509 family)
MPHDIRALLLDLDGTIADTMPHLCRSFRHAVEPFAKRLPTDAEVISTFGPPERVNLTMLLEHPEIGQPGAVRHLDEAERRYHEYYEGRHGDVRAYPGIFEALRQAQAKQWRVGVFTGKSRRSATFALNDLGLADEVDYLIGGDEVTKPKPDPEGIQRSAQHFGLESTQLLFVGDSPGDIVAGRAVRTPTVGALWGAFQVEATLNERPTWAFQTVAELAHLIHSLAPISP